MNISGGSISAAGYALYLNNTGQVTLSGGTIVGNEIAVGMGGYGVYAQSSPVLVQNNVSITGTGTGSYGLVAAGTASVTITGGSITASGGQEGFGVYDQSSQPLSLQGGTVTAGVYSTGLYASGGTVNISGGAINVGASSYALDVHGGGTVNMTGGTITGGATSNEGIGVGLYATGSGKISISGGTITGGQGGYAVYATSNSPIAISGGTIMSGGSGYAVYASAGATVTITGGQVSVADNISTGLDANGGTIIVAGGDIASDLLAQGGTIDLFSLDDSPFLINGVPMNNTSLTASGFTGTIIGVLANGDTLDTTFTNDGTINLNLGTPPAVPEPASLFMLGVGGLSFLRRRLRRMSHV